MEDNLVTRFMEAQANSQSLIEMRTANIISEDSFKSAMFQQMVLCEDEWWCCDVSTGEWNVFRDNKWTKELPPYVV